MRLIDPGARGPFIVLGIKTIITGRITSRITSIVTPVASQSTDHVKYLISRLTV